MTRLEAMEALRACTQSCGTRGIYPGNGHWAHTHGTVSTLLRALSTTSWAEALRLTFGEPVTEQSFKRVLAQLDLDYHRFRRSQTPCSAPTNE